MEYGKLVNGVLQIAGAYIKTADREYFNPSDKLKIELGFLPVIGTAMPVKEGFYHTDEWQEVKGELVQVWAEHEFTLPEPDPTAARLKKLETELTAAKAEIETLKTAQTEQAIKMTALDTAVKMNIETVASK